MRSSGIKLAENEEVKRYSFSIRAPCGMHSHWQLQSHVRFTFLLAYGGVKLMSDFTVTEVLSCTAGYTLSAFFITRISETLHDTSVFTGGACTIMPVFKAAVHGLWFCFFSFFVLPEPGFLPVPEAASFFGVSYAISLAAPILTDRIGECAKMNVSCGLNENLMLCFSLVPD